MNDEKNVKSTGACESSGNMRPQMKGHGKEKIHTIVNFDT